MRSGGVGLTYTETSTYTCIRSGATILTQVCRARVRDGPESGQLRLRWVLCLGSLLSKRRGACPEPRAGVVDIAEEHRVLLFRDRGSHFALFDIIALQILGRWADCSRVSGVIGASVAVVTLTRASEAAADGAHLRCRRRMFLQLSTPGLESSTNVVHRISDPAMEASDMIPPPQRLLGGGQEGPLDALLVLRFSFLGPVSRTDGGW